MPNWKKLITSGSDASLSSLFVTNAVTASRFSGSFTGSLQGTASWASNAISSSFASTASYVNPLNQNVTISGSLLLNGTNGPGYNIQTINSSLILEGAAGGGAPYAGQLRITANTSAWVDGVTSSYFQLKTTGSFGSNNYVVFQGGTYGTDAPFDRLQFASKYTSFTNGAYGTTPVPLHLVEIANTGSNIPLLGLRGAPSQTANYVNINASGSATGSLFSITKDGVVMINTTASSTEGNLFLGGLGPNEGGQLFLQSGLSYTSGAMLDNYQDRLRILRGTNTTSNAELTSWNLTTKQLTLPAYSGSGAFPGTAAANLAVDSSGNVITIAAGSTALTGGATNYVARWASSTTLTTGSIYDSASLVGIGTITPVYKLDVSGNIHATTTVYVDASNAAYLRGGDDHEWWDINVVNTAGLYGVQNSAVGGLKLGSGGPTLYGSGSNLGIGTTSPQSRLTVYDLSNTFPLTAGGNSATPNVVALGTVSSVPSINGYTYNFGATTNLSLQPNGGSVGINTTSPAALLDVNGTTVSKLYGGSGSAPVYAQFDAYMVGTNPTYGNNYAYYGMHRSGFVSWQLGMISSSFVIARGGGASQFTLWPDRPFAIDSSNNVGIGTITPATRLHTVGSTESTAAAGVARLGFADSSSVALFTNKDPLYGTLFGTLSTGKGWIQQQRVDGTATAYDLILQPNGGNVGIGTTSPGAIFDINGSLSNGRSIIRVTNSDTTNYITIGAGIPSISNAGMNFAVDGTSRMVINSSGYVGIGTTSPATTLHVTGITRITQNAAALQLYGTNHAYMEFYPTASAGRQAYFGFPSVGTKQIHLVNEATSGGDIILIPGSGGNVGINATSPGYKLDVAGAIRSYIDATYNGENGALIASNATNTNKRVFIGYDSGIDAGFITSVFSGTAYKNLILQGVSVGNVGIGTTTPSTKLEVNGAIKTAAPTGYTAKAWKLGDVNTGTCVPGDFTSFGSWFTGTVISIEVDGTTYTIPAVISNYC